MLGSKLIQICNTLDKKEIVRLHQYLQSPFFNKSDKVLQLFELIKEHHGDYENNPALEKAIVFKRLFPEKKKQDSSLRALMSQLTKHLEDFLGYIAYEKNKYLQEQLLTNSLVSRRLDDIFKKTFNSISNKKVAPNTQDLDYFHHQFQLAHINYQNVILSHSRTFEAGLQSVMDGLDIYYIASKLKYTVALINRQHILDKTYNLYMLDEVLQLVENSFLAQDIPFIQFYYHLCLLLKEEDDKHYHKLKELLLKHPNSLIESEERQIYMNMSNYCTRKMKTGEAQYLQELFDIYAQMHNKSFHLVDGIIRPSAFKNIVTVGLRCKEYEWTQQFIEEYQFKLDERQRDKVVPYALALLYFHLKDYDKTTDYLLNADFVDVFYKISYKILLIKTYYELDEISVLKSAIESFRIYLMREKHISEVNRKAYQNFVNLTKKLIRIKTGGNKSPQALKEAIQNAERIADQQWLLEKVYEFMQESVD